MDVRVKDTALFILIILVILSFLFIFNVGTKSAKYRKSFEKEMVFRLDMEEKVNKLMNENMTLAAELKNRDIELKDKKASVQELNNIVAKKEEEINTLRSEIEKLNLLKDKLEDDLKESLAKQQKK